MPPPNLTLGLGTWAELEDWDDDARYYKDMVEYQDKVIGLVEQHFYPQSQQGVYCRSRVRRDLARGPVTGAKIYRYDIGVDCTFGQFASWRDQCFKTTIGERCVVGHRR